MKNAAKVAHAEGRGVAAMLVWILAGVMFGIDQFNFYQAYFSSSKGTIEHAPMRSLKFTPDKLAYIDSTVRHAHREHLSSLLTKDFP